MASTNPAASIAKGHVPYDYRDPNRSSLTPRKIPASRVVQALDEAGFPESEWALGVAIARRESSFVPDLIGAVNAETREHDPENASWDFGLFQISYRWNSHLMQGPKKIGDWDDPVSNAKMAKYLYDESVRRGYVGWRPWNTYTSGGYKQYMDLALDAVAEYKASKASVPETTKPVAPGNVEGGDDTKETAVGRMPQATWKPIPGNHTTGGCNPRNVIVHTIEGSLTGADSWFRNPASRVSAHFGVGYDGRIIQWVDTNSRAWANASANSIAISIENEGKGSEALTKEQIESNAAIYAWAHKTHGVPLAYTKSATGSGLGYHRQFLSWSLGGTACPGTKKINQIPEIMKRAAEIVGGAVPKLPKPGTGGGGSSGGSGGLTSQRSITAQQQAVNAAGYSPRLTVDGLWGPKTEAGVKWYQKKIGVSADGLWGPATETAHKKKVGSVPSNTPAPSNKLKEDGLMGPATVRRLQQLLNGGKF